MVEPTKVFVGNLPQGSKPEELRKLFEGFGVVTECTVIKRCGFVHMQTEEQATAAIRDLNNCTFNGGKILVEKGKSKPRGRAIRGAGWSGGMRGGSHRGTPYLGERGRGRSMQGIPPMNRGMSIRNGGGYNRGSPMRGRNNPRNNAYGVVDSRGFTLMEPPDTFAVPPPMYCDNRQAYAADDLAGRRTPTRRPPMFHEDSVALIGSSDFCARRAEPNMHAPVPAPGGYPYAQYSPMGRGGSAARH